MQKLGTHNSLSYCPPQWYMMPFAWMGRCQNLTIFEQYRYGVRYYDIRLKFLFPKKGEMKVVSGHGLLTYDIDPETVIAYLDSRKGCHVRLGIENMKSIPENREAEVWEYIHLLTVNFPDVAFDVLWVKNPYTVVVDLGVKTEERYERFDNGDLKIFGITIKWKIPWPKIYAMCCNSTYKYCADKARYLILDFVEL